jgi:hypothetical protein
VAAPEKWDLCVCFPAAATDREAGAFTSGLTALGWCGCGGKARKTTCTVLTVSVMCGVQSRLPKLDAIPISSLFCKHTTHCHQRQFANALIAPHKNNKMYANLKKSLRFKVDFCCNPTVPTLKDRFVKCHIFRKLNYVLINERLLFMDDEWLKRAVNLLIRVVSKH